MLRAPHLSAVALAAALALTACGGGDDAGTAGQSESGAIAVEATDTLKYSETELAAAPGEVTIELGCGDAVGHNLVIEESDTIVAECDAGATDTGSVTLEAGTYTYYCSIPGHRQAGMEGTLTVS